MRYDRDDLQELLAAEYVLGNLRGAARLRFVTLMRRRPVLHDKVARWEERLFPLMLHAPRVQAPERLWRAIRSRISARGPAPASGLVRGWRRVGLAGVALALAGLLYLDFRTPLPMLPSPATMIAVLNGPRAQPALLVSWTADRPAPQRLRIRVLAHPDMASGTSWQAWIVTADSATPIQAGLIGGEETQVLALSGAAADALPRAVAIGVTVEPKGGSTTGRPSGPFLLEGPALRVDADDTVATPKDRGPR